MCVLGEKVELTLVGSVFMDSQSAGHKLVPVCHHVQASYFDTHLSKLAHSHYSAIFFFSIQL